MELESVVKVNNDCYGNGRTIIFMLDSIAIDTST